MNGWRPRAARWLRLGGAALVALVVLVFTLAGGYLGWARLRPLTLAVSAPGFVVDAAGVATHVERWPAARPQGLAPLILVPGFAESTYVWSRVAPLLATDRDVYAYDVRGYGFSDRVPPYTLDSDTDQLAGVIAALHLSRPVVVGHSLGVAIALSQALRSPASLTGVVAANGDGTPYFGTDRTSTGGAEQTLLIDPVASAVATVIVRHRTPIRDLVESRCGPGCPVDDAAIDRWRAPFLVPGGVAALLAVLRRPLIGLTDEQERAVTVPTAVLFSGADPIFDRASALATGARLRSGTVTGLPGARHLALLGEPQRFASALEAELHTFPGS
jgi:pimeloyl-ACP methyl ester carboxylesterase